MSQFRKKPCVIDAVQFTNMGSPAQQQAMLRALDGCTGWHMSDDGCINIVKGAGIAVARPGDWVCRQVVNGRVDVWPCEASIFSATYEPVGAAVPAPSDHRENPTDA